MRRGTTNGSSGTSRGGWVVPVAVVVVGVALMIGLIKGGGGGVAAMPHEFRSDLSVRDAIAQSASTGSAVVVLATADWCPPCQNLKRNALADPRVGEWLTAHRTTAVSVDFTDPSSPQATDAGETLGIEVLPTMIFIADGKPVSTHTGSDTAEGVIAWLESASK